MADHLLGEPITMINVFEVPVDLLDDFVSDWRERALIMSSLPGFRDFRMHRAISADFRFQLVNVAHWDSLESYRAAMANPEFMTRLDAAYRNPELNFTANPGVYQVIVSMQSDGTLQ
ncbi:antibiotic biosynthesis monooxygenase family protein [Actinomadura scrupuli]|uniref:antibiotic biosynthesis monooxygenase family protein n=1 Tax=Actinomadura scrupuli TaxID=559629 RepID=UPI003D99BC2A